MDKIRVVALTEWFLPGTGGGGPVKSLYSLAHLLKNEVDFYIITANRDIKSKESYNLPVDTPIHKEAYTVIYLQKGFNAWKKIPSLTRGIDPHIVYINGLFSVDFSIIPVFMKRAGLIQYPVLIAPRGMLEKGTIRIKFPKKRFFLFMAKIIKLYRGNLIYFHATSESEKKNILRYIGYVPIFIVPNYSPVLAPFVPLIKKENEIHLVFIGRIAEETNLLFAIRTIKEFSDRSDLQITFHIYGNVEEVKYYHECMELADKISRPHIQICYKGSLSFEEVPHTIQKYHFLFRPSVSENFGHSIIEALASGRPVIISNTNPWTGINESGCGWRLPLSIEKMKEALTAAIKMPDDRYQQMCFNALKYASEKMDPQRIKNQYIQMFINIVKAKK